MVTDAMVEAAALALLNTGCVREPVAATESFMLARARSMARAALEAAEKAREPHPLAQLASEQKPLLPEAHAAIYSSLDELYEN